MATGEEIFKKLSVRDYTNSDSDNYAQDLQTYFFESASNGQADEFFLLLERAEKEGKKIVLDKGAEESDEYSIDSFTLA